MRKNMIAVVIAISALALFAGGRNALSQISGMDKKAKAEWYKEVENFADALAIVHSGYVEEVKPKDLIYGSLNGMLGSLDPYSQFLDPESYEELKTDTEGKFGGLGIEITIRDGLLTVITPIEDTPAWKAGIKPGDRIVKIGDELTRDMDLLDAVKKMRGKPGEAIKLTVLRESEKRLIEFDMIREIIRIHDIKQARILQDGIGYIKLSEFREETPQEFRAALEKLLQEKMTAFILDLRNNPGGLLEVAVAVTENFVEPGKMIVFTKGRKQDQNAEFVSHASRPVISVPMVVMINQGSASGSEIVAGCLQDYRRALILGQTSFGKGSVQTVIPLSDGSALRLTTSRYFTPLGNIIHNKGVTPDIVADEAVPEEDAANAADSSVKAAAVFKQVEEHRDQMPATLFSEPVHQPDAAKKPEFDYTKDPQILRAIDALKAINLYRGAKK